MTGFPGSGFCRNALPLFCIFAFFLGGCGDDKPRVEVLSIEGTIEAIDARKDGTGSVKVSYFSPKRQEEIVGTGMVTKETEILINGAVATLKDLRVGDRVRSDVRVEKKNGARTLVALTVYIDRATTGGN